MHLIIDDVAGHSEIDRINNLVVTVVLVAIEVRCLSTVTYGRQSALNFF